MKKIKNYQDKRMEPHPILLNLKSNWHPHYTQSRAIFRDNSEVNNGTVFRNPGREAAIACGLPLMNFIKTYF